MKRTKRRLTALEVIEELRGEVAMYRDSYRHRIGPHKGRVIEPAVLRTIAALQVAIAVVAASRLKSKENRKP